MSNLPVGPIKGLEVYNDADVAILSWDDTLQLKTGSLFTVRKALGVLLRKSVESEEM